MLEQAGDDRTLGLIWYMLAHVHGGFHCRYRESAEAAERALEYYTTAGWPVTPCLQELAVSLYLGPVPVGAAVRRCNELLEQADRGGAAHVLVFRAGLQAMAGAFDDARSLAASARASYEELDWADKVWENYAPIAAEIELLAGDYAAAEHLLRENCSRLEAWGEHARLATQAARLGETLYREARFDEAMHWVEVAERNAASDDASAQYLWRSLRAKGRARDGAFDEADALARRATAIAASTDALSPRAEVLLDAAEVGLLSDRAEIALEWAREAARLFEEKENVASLPRAWSLLEQLPID